MLIGRIRGRLAAAAKKSYGLRNTAALISSNGFNQQKQLFHLYTPLNHSSRIHNSVKYIQFLWFCFYFFNLVYYSSLGFYQGFTPFPLFGKDLIFLLFLGCVLSMSCLYGSSYHLCVKVLIFFWLLFFDVKLLLSTTHFEHSFELKFVKLSVDFLLIVIYFLWTSFVSRRE